MMNFYWVANLHQLVATFRVPARGSLKGGSTVYSYFEKGCQKKCARDNPER